MLALNTLQSNAKAIEKAKLERDKNAPLNVPRMRSFAARVGITVSTVLLSFPLENILSPYQGFLVQAPQCQLNCVHHYSS